MYTSVKRLAMFSFVMSVFTVVAALLLLIHFSSYADFTLRFTWCLYVITASVGFLLVSWGLFNLSKDIDLSTWKTKHSKQLEAGNQKVSGLKIPIF